jgi:hypothetical protein
MFGRFDDAARRVVVIAQDEARVSRRPGGLGFIGDEIEF